jgi:hypothetical protein
MVVGLLLTVRIVGLITRMPRIDRPPIKANIGAETAWLDKPLGTIVATLAQALKRAEPEFVDIAVMWLDVIADFRRLDDAALCAILAQRMFTQLVSRSGCLRILAQRAVEYHLSHSVSWPRMPHGSTYHSPAIYQAPRHAVRRTGGRTHMHAPIARCSRLTSAGKA